MQRRNRHIRLLFLSSETGGGHTAAAHAVATAVTQLAPQAECLIVDVLREHSALPFRYFPTVYGPLATQAPWLWEALFRVTDSRTRAELLTIASWPLAARRLRRMMRQHEPDMLVSFHPLLVRPAVRLGREWAVPVCCVVTDLVRLHAFWLDPAVDLYCLPTAEAAEAAKRMGIDAERIIVSGQPIPPSMAAPQNRLAARQALQLDPELPLVLLTGGGAGIGPLRPTAEAIAQLGIPLQLAVICGRNERLRQQLQRCRWPVPTFVLGFVHNMPQWLAAADILVAKAGPGTLAEALAAGVPTVVVYALPGQEEANVEFLRSQGAAIWAPQPQQAAAAVARLLQDPSLRQELAAKATRAARPQAATTIAKALIDLLAARRAQAGAAQASGAIA